MMLRFGFGFLAIAAMAACSGGGNSNNPPGSSADGGPPIGGDNDGGTGPGPIGATPVTITITTTVFGTSQSLGGKTNATWGAYRKDDGSWAALASPPPTSAGTYTFETRATRWAVALVCANDRSSLVAIHEDVATVQSAEITLESYCGAPPTDYFSITGTISNVPGTTSWLDFGYPLEARGVALPVNGTNAAYEEVNLVAGTWDFAFGLRDDSTQALTKVALLRNHTLAADETLNVDIAGAVSFAPETKKLTIHAIDPTENINAPVRYTTNGGGQGLDVGPQNVGGGGGAPDAALMYATIPALAQVATDRYRVDITSDKGADEGSSTGTSRNVLAVFHDPTDLDITLPAQLDGVTAKVESATPYTRITTILPARANTIYVESASVAKIANNRLRTWRVSMSAAALGTNTSLTLPDLSAVAGFDTSWVLPTDIDREITTTMRETPIPVGDGTLTRSSSQKITLSP